MVDIERGQHGPIKVLVIEDTGSWRDYVAETLARYGQQIEVVGLADNTEDAVEKASQTRPDVTLADLKLYEFAGNSHPSSRSTATRKGKHGVIAIRRIRHILPDVCILVMSQFGKSFGEPVIISALWSGIDGYIRKDDDRFEMRNLPMMVERVLDGYSIYDDNIAQVMMKYIPGNILSDVESNVLSLIADGMNDDEVADQLKIRLEDVRGHRRTILSCWRGLNFEEIMLRFDAHGLEEIL